MFDAPDELNLVKNPRLSEGLRAPRGWRWMGDPGAVAWSREPSANGQGPVMTLRARQSDAGGGWARRVRCKPNAHYRVEVVVSGSATRASSDGDSSGFLLSIQPLRDGKPVDRACELPAPPTLDQPTRLRAYYRAPDDVRSLEVRVGLEPIPMGVGQAFQPVTDRLESRSHTAYQDGLLAQTGGTVRIHEVMLFEILEPEAQSHVLACPPPPYAYPVPVRVQTICVCSGAGDPRGNGSRPIRGLLAQRFGPRKVHGARPDGCSAGDLEADAVIFPDALPRWASNLSALEKLASGHVVVVSLPEFARLAGDAVAVRTIRQADDPIHAKVAQGNFLTRGFCIGDVFPYAWRDGDARVFVQRHFRRTLAFKEYCRRHGFDTILLSVCNIDAATDCPMSLYKPTGGGGIVVLDIEPAEDTPTNFDEPDLAFYLLGNALGAEQNTLGQYVCPARTERELRDEVAEFGQRYDGLVVRGCDHPDKPRRDQLVEVGGVVETFGLPIVRRPLVLIRTGLRGDDADGVYGTMLWLKNLVRPEPHVCPYGAELVSRFRLGWIPLCAEWHEAQGWRRPPDDAQLSMDADFEPETLAAVIDVTSTPRQEVRVVVNNEQARSRWGQHLPELARRLIHNRFYYRAVPASCPVADRSAADWRLQALEPVVVADDTGVFDTEFHRRAGAAGATLVRLEFPGPLADLTAGSIWRTDLVAQTLEHVVGLLYGWIAMNRRDRAVRIAAPAVSPAAEVRQFSAPASDPVSVRRSLTPGKLVSIPCAAALCVSEK